MRKILIVSLFAFLLIVPAIFATTYSNGRRLAYDNRWDYQMMDDSRYDHYSSYRQTYRTQNNYRYHSYPTRATYGYNTRYYPSRYYSSYSYNSRPVRATYTTTLNGYKGYPVYY